MAPTKEKSAFNAGKKPVNLKNIVKEKELEQSDLAKKKAPGAKSGKRKFKRVPEPREEDKKAADEQRKKGTGRGSGQGK